MSFAEVRDHALWVGDIYGNKPLQELIIAMEPGEQIELQVEGFRGRWEKLPVRGDTPGHHGVKASGEAQRLWLAQRDVRWAGIVSVKVCDD